MFSDVVSWSIVLIESEKVIGYCFFHSFNPVQKKAEIAFGISRQYWSVGYATEATRKVIDYGFTNLKLKRIEGTCMMDNNASSRVLEKSGMCYEGVLKKARERNGVLHDLKLYSISPNDNTP